MNWRFIKKNFQDGFEDVFIQDRSSARCIQGYQSWCLSKIGVRPGVSRDIKVGVYPGVSRDIKVGVYPGVSRCNQGYQGWCLSKIGVRRGVSRDIMVGVYPGVSRDIKVGVYPGISRLVFIHYRSLSRSIPGISLFRFNFDLKS